MDLSRGAQRLLDLLNWYGKKFDRIYPSQAKLAEHLKVTVRQIQRYVRELREATMVRVKRAGRNAAEYILELAGKMSGRSRVDVASKSGRTETAPYYLNEGGYGPLVARKLPRRADPHAAVWARYGV